MSVRSCVCVCLYVSLFMTCIAISQAGGTTFETCKRLREEEEEEEELEFNKKAKVALLQLCVNE